MFNLPLRSCGSLEPLESRLFLSSVNTGADPSFILDLNGQAYFRADDGIHGRELWTSDGTADGTELAVDLNADSAESISWMKRIDGLLYIANRNGLWSSDGSVGGTRQIADVAPDYGDFEKVGSEIYFFAGGEKRALYKTGGSIASTAKVKAFDDVLLLGRVNGSIVYLAKDWSRDPFAARGPYRLWASGGAAGAGTLLSQTQYTYGGRDLVQVASYKNSLYFTNGADWNGLGGGLWKTNATAGGTVKLSNVTASDLAVVGDSLLLVASSNINNTASIWKSDGAAATVKLLDLPQSVSSSGSRAMTLAGGQAWFVSDVLWTSDATVGGTHPVKNVAPEVIVDAAGTVYFTANDGHEIWRTDGTSNGTTPVVQLGQMQASGVSAVGGQLFFQANDGTHGRELWTSDGSQQGTSLVKDINLQPLAVPQIALQGDRRASNADNLVNDRSPTLWVWPNSDAKTLVLYVDGAEVGNMAFSNSVTVPGALSDGPHQIAVAVGGADGIPVAQSPSLTVTIDATAPTGTPGEFSRASGGAPRLSYHFSEDVSMKLAPLVLWNLDTNLEISPRSYQVDYDSATNTAALTLSKLGKGALADGRYRATIPAADTSDRAGNPLAGDVSLDFNFANFGASPTAQASLSRGVLRLAGTSAADQIILSRGGKRAARLVVELNGVTSLYQLDGVKLIIVTAGGGDDLIQLDQTNAPIKITTKLYGEAGNDSILGGATRDRIYGGDGNDSIRGGSGHDIIYGDAGDDAIFGEAGNDYLVAGEGTNSIQGNRGRDRIFAIASIDKLLTDKHDILQTEGIV